MVYIANIVKCRPPHNRVPEAFEQNACLPYLRAQFVLVRPKILVCLGATAAKAVIRPDLRITRERGIWVDKKGTQILPTYHPSALLRDETGEKKREAWQDMKALRDRMKEMGSTRSGSRSRWIKKRDLARLQEECAAYFNELYAPDQKVYVFGDGDPRRA